jgi:hypothetical protein
VSTTAPAKLRCPECRRENEPERIYCHDCGARLDHSALASQGASSAETPEQLHKRVSYMFSPRRGRTKAILVKWVKLLLGAALAALVLVILLPPPLPPVQKSEAEGLPPQISLDLENMTTFHRPSMLRYSEDDANAYLAYVLRKKESLNHPLLDFERAVLQFHPGVCDFTIARSIFGYSIYTGGTFVVKLQSGKVSASPLSGAIGRLPVHPTLMHYADFLFGDVIAALERERKLVERAGAIEMREREIVFAAP